MTKRAAILYLSVIGILLAGVAAIFARAFADRASDNLPFDGERALADVYTQVAFGPRTPGSQGLDRVREWMRSELQQAGWTVEIQEAEMLGHPIENIVASRSSLPPQIVLGAHYDTRLVADQDSNPANRSQPVPGANDGASGVAVLLELARNLPADTVPIWLVLFDAEDNGDLPDLDWTLGSRAFVKEYPIEPQAVVILDMIGDADLNIYMERNSDPAIRAEIWRTAEDLGYANFFIPQLKFSMLDDHTPFREAGLPAVLVIDFDYEYWHTVEDTPDKVSAASLQVVGDTILAWIMNRQASPE